MPESLLTSGLRSGVADGRGFGDLRDLGECASVGAGVGVADGVGCATGPIGVGVTFLKYRLVIGTGRGVRNARGLGDRRKPKFFSKCE